MFKDIIKDLRESQDMSQYELARALQVSQSAIAKWELGKTEPTSSALVSIARFFNVSADYLLELEDEFGNKKRCDNRTVFYLIFVANYASLIAPTGQPSSHAPQSMHCSGSTTYLLSPSAIAPTGQVSAQAPHWMHSSLITLGIVLSPYKYIRFRLQLY